jgi:flagellar biosynthesis/type III secretory pathway chaperone
MLLIEFVEQLLEVLGDQKELYSELNTLSEAKQTAISANDIQALDEIVQKEQSGLMRLLELERRRKACTEEIAKQKNLSQTGFSIDNVRSTASNEQQKRLDTVQKELSALMLRQKELNDTNRSLIEGRLEFINFMMSAMSPADQQLYTYGAQGMQLPGQTKNSILDSSV